MSADKKNLPHAQNGRKLKLLILAKFHTLVKFAEVSKISYDVLRDYTCGKIKPSPEREELIKKTLKDVRITTR